MSIDFSVIFEDLDTDARTWREVGGGEEMGGGVGSAAQTVGDSNPLGMTYAVTIDELGSGVSDAVGYVAGFKEAYNSLATWALDYLREGVTAIEGIAGRLEATKTEFESSEEYAEWLANGSGS